MEDELMLLQNLATSSEFFSGPYVLKHLGATALALSTTLYQIEKPFIYLLVVISNQTG